MSDQDMVSVPRWVLDELIPAGLGAAKILRAQKQAGGAEYVPDSDIDKLEAAVADAFERFEKQSPSSGEAVETET